MIDVWLIASLVKPFLDILIQTYIDSLRDDSQREINHHGEPREVGDKEAGTSQGAKLVQVAPLEKDTGKKLVSIDERIQQDALKEFYRQKVDTAREAKIERMKKISLKINPLSCIAFVIAYWVIGLKQYYAEF